MYRKLSVSLLLWALFTLELPAQNRTLQEGQTYPIEETDLREEIQQRGEQVNWSAKYQNAIDRWKRKPGTYLPEATETTQRSYTPWYELPFDIPQENGEVLYPAGYRFNPLAYTTLPGRLVVINDKPNHYQWVQTQLRDTDRLIVAGGNIALIREQHQLDAYAYDPRMRERFGVMVVPSVIAQDKTAFHIKEVALHETVLP